MKRYFLQKQRLFVAYKIVAESAANTAISSVTSTYQAFASVSLLFKVIHIKSATFFSFVLCQIRRVLLPITRIQLCLSHPYLYFIGRSREKPSYKTVHRQLGIQFLRCQDRCESNDCSNVIVSLSASSDQRTGGGGGAETITHSFVILLVN